MLTLYSFQKNCFVVVLDLSKWADATLCSYWELGPNITESQHIHDGRLLRVERFKLSRLRYVCSAQGNVKVATEFKAAKLRPKTPGTTCDKAHEISGGSGLRIIIKDMKYTLLCILKFEKFLNLILLWKIIGNTGFDYWLWSFVT